MMRARQRITNHESRITNEDAGKRLDLFLTEKIEGFSRSQIQKMIKDGAITVNDRIVAPHRFLKTDDTILITPPVIPAKAGIPSLHVNPRVLAETSEYLIIDKPAGLLVHPTTLSVIPVGEACPRPSSDSIRGSGAGIPSLPETTLVDWLLEHYPEIKKVGDDPLRPGIVHRLDKDASGVMVVARTQDSFESLIRQFKLRQVKKEYLTLVSGRVTPTEGVIDLPIGRSAKDYTKRAAHSATVIPSLSRDPAALRKAITKYEVLEQFKHTALVRVMPETGRTHQIRVHFFSKGNPILGDPIYKMSSRAKRGRAEALAKAGRLMLHASLLGFRDLSGAYHEYTSPLPAAFNG